MKIKETKSGVEIYAEEGMILQRKADKLPFGKVVYLGYTSYIGGKLLDKPKLEVPEDFEEIKENDYGNS